MAEQARLLQQVERLLQQHPLAAGRELRLQVEAPPRAFTHSQLLRLTLLIEGAAAGRLVLKLPQGEGGADPIAEFFALKRLQVHFGDRPHLHSPRPLLACRQPPALLMEAVAGMPLHHVLAGRRRPHPAAGLELARTAATLAGEWLAHLHRLPLSPTASNLAPLASRFEAALADLARLRVDSNSLMTIRNTYCGLGTINEESPFVTLHGDFTLRNILALDRGGLAVLDTDLQLAGPAAYDLGHFLAATLFVDRWQLLSRGWIYDQDSLMAIRNILIEAYRAAGDAVDTAIVRRYAAIRLLERWAQYAHHLRRTHPLLARLLLPLVAAPYFQRQVLRLLA